MQVLAVVMAETLAAGTEPDRHAGPAAEGRLPPALAARRHLLRAGQGPRGRERHAGRGDRRDGRQQLSDRAGTKKKSIIRKALAGDGRTKVERLDAALYGLSPGAIHQAPVGGRSHPGGVIEHACGHARHRRGRRRPIAHCISSDLGEWLLTAYSCPEIAALEKAAPEGAVEYSTQNACREFAANPLPFFTILHDPAQFTRLNDALISTHPFDAIFLRAKGQRSCRPSVPPSLKVCWPSLSR